MRQIASFAPAAFALLLLIAAGLKAQAILSTDSIEPGSIWWRGWEWAVVAIEWGLGGWILSGIAPVWARRAAMAILAIFLAVAGTRALRGDADCGCFGRVHSSPLLTIAIDAFALAGIWYSGRVRHGSLGAERASMGGPMDRWRRSGAILFAAVCVPPAAAWGMSYSRIADSRAAPLVVLDPPSWKGHRFPLLGHLQPSRQDLSHGRWAVLIVDRNCHLCRDFLSRADFGVIAREGGGNRQPRAAIAIDVGRETGSGSATVNASVPVLLTRPDISYLAGGPFEVFLNDGVVEAAHSAAP